MAGAGYKLFNTGDVLTAAQVNTYLMEQTVMVFNDAASRTTALSGVVAEGMLSYLKSTKQVEVYNGSAWVASDDPNAIQNTIVDAKGDLIAATANDTPARLAVGNNGETLVADSSTSTGLRWQPSQAAGKNVIINGAFDIWQRGTSFTNSTTYTADRWAPHRGAFVGGCTVTQQTITPADVGNSARFAMRVQRVSGNTSTQPIFIVQPIESAAWTPLAGSTVTLSLWVRRGADYSGGANVDVVLISGTSEFTVGGGGGTITGVASASRPISSTWSRISITGTVPASGIAGLAQVNFTPSGTAGANDWIEMTGVQLELGSTPTTFTRAGGTLAGELAACQRYCVVIGGDSAYEPVAFGTTGSTTTLAVYRPLAQPMRIVPSLTVNSVSNWNAILLGVAAQVLTGMTISTDSSKTVAVINGTFSSNGNFGGSKAAAIQAANTTSAQVILSAEL